ncbi:MAG TPA: hypothetical protein VFK05_17890 [Polyangiaceae bacterium]|nr:hypothetical protein [Polyangiaceae bacterium]
MKLMQCAMVCAAISSAVWLGGCADADPSRTDDAASSQSESVESLQTKGDSELRDLPSTASVDLRTNLGVLSAIAVGANAAAWDHNLIDPGVPDLLEDANIQVMRYPGGSTSDNYHWLSNTPDDPAQGGTDPVANFDAYMSVVERAGARAMITVNYGSGTPAEAADWVRYANLGGRHYRGPVPTYPGASPKGHDYDIRYWEIGNELYGNGTYGATWEVDHKAHNPTTYANGVVSYSAAMKAVDPSIRIGAVLTAPGNWPDGQTNVDSPEPWNDTVLPIACSALDFVSIHWYPQGPTGESDADLLASPANGQATPVSYTPSIADMVATLRAKLSQYCGAHAKAVQIMVTETNSVSYNPGKQTTSLVNALFLTDQVLTWLENGVSNVDWWAIHNSPFDGNNDPALYGNYDFGDYGILSRGLTSENGALEPPAETPFPAYYGLQMLARLGHSSRSQLLAASSSTPLIAIHAVKQVDGKVNALLLNKSPSDTYTVSVTLKGGSARGLARVFSYGKGDPSIRSSAKLVFGASFTTRLGPYSLTTIQLP